MTADLEYTMRDIRKTFETQMAISQKNVFSKAVTFDGSEVNGRTLVVKLVDVSNIPWSQNPRSCIFNSPKELQGLSVNIAVWTPTFLARQERQ